MAEPVIRHVSDTARLVATYRAVETDRPDALFRDPFARRLSGLRGEALAREMDKVRAKGWIIALRTHLLDQMIARAVDEGFDAVVNLAAGLDARPYRLRLPASLRWYEVDLPEILAEKEAALAAEQPRCALERVPLDLVDGAGRRALFARIAATAKRVLVVSEGLLGYLAPDDVAALARDLAAAPGFERWAFELPSPGLRRLLEREDGKRMEQAGAAFRFGPEEGPAFFAPYGWKAREVHSVLQAAARARRLNPILRLLAWVPEPADGRVGRRPWVGVCLMERG